MTARHVLLGLLLACLPATAFAAPAPDAPAPPDFRRCAGTYASPPRLADKRVDVPRLLGQLRDLNADTYNWLVWTGPDDWADLKAFLPVAREQGVRVWVTLVPPSESPPHAKHFSEPFKLDYFRWATEIARLSVEHPNLVAWSIDDFTHNLRVFTPAHLGEMLGKAREINPKLAFVPCCYFKSVTPTFAERYGKLLDGVLFPYRNESRGANLKDADAVTAEVARLRELLGPKVAIIVDVYSSRHSTLGSSTPEYVRDVTADALKSADGVIIYCHPRAEYERAKYNAVRELYRGRADHRK
jgi:hypothetical protein